MQNAIVTVYLMGIGEEVSKRGNNYAVAKCMDEKGRRQNLFMDDVLSKKVKANLGDYLTPDLQNLKALDAEIDAFANRMVDLRIK
jgi:hypothetical protein